MKRNYKFTPYKLISLKKELGISEKKYEEKMPIASNSVEFKNFLNKLVSMDIEEVPYFVMKYEHYYFRLLSSYIANKKVEVPLENCFRALELKFRNEFMNLAYNAYQHTLGNNEFVIWFKKIALLHPEILIKSKISLINLAKYIDDLYPAKLFVEYSRKNNKNINVILDEFAIDNNSLLHKIIDIEYLITASKKEYLNLDKVAFLEKANSFSMQDQGRLFNNYLSVVSINESNIEYLKSIYSKYKTPIENKTMFWSYISKDVIQIFLNWINVENINQVLGNDERSRYWRRYSEYLKTTYVQEARGQIALDFGSFVVVEFTNIGAAYFYKKEVFDTNFKKHFMKNHSIGDSSLKDVSLMIDKLAHSGQWQPRFDQFMANLGVRFYGRYR